MKRALLLVLVGFALLRADLPARADADAIQDPLARLAAAVAEHPQDPDLAFAYARALRAEGSYDAALALLAPWTGAADREVALEARFELGRTLHAAGRSEAALEHFETVIEARPLLHSARLHRALALEALGRDAEAERELLVVEAIAPELRSEARLLRGLAAWKRGEDEQAFDVLRALVDDDPDSEPARRARLVLADAPAAGGPARGAVWVRAGVERDSNVSLDSGGPQSTIVSDSADTRAVVGAGVVVQPLATERAGWSVGYAYDQSEHQDLDSYDAVTHSLFSSLVWAPAPAAALRVDGSVSSQHLDGSRYARSWLVRPNLIYRPGESGLEVKVYGETGRVNFHESPLFSSLEQGGVTHAGGLEVGFPLGPTRAALAGRLSRRRSTASRDVIGFKGDYDGRGQELRATVAAPLGRDLDLRVEGRLGRERFENRNLTDALTDEGVGTASPDRRRDSIGRGSVVLGYAARPWLRLELRWDGVRQRSNVDVYDYERHVLGFQALGQWTW